MDMLITKIDGWNPKHVNGSDDDPNPLKEAFANNVKRKGESFVPLHTQHRFALPYKINSEEGTYYEPNFSDPYSFTALAIKGISLDLDRLYKEFETIAERDYAMFKNLIEPYVEAGSKEESQLMIRRRLVQFRGDEERYRGTVQEAQENLFYWHLAQKFENTTVFRNKKEVKVSKNLYGENRLEEFYNLGRNMQEVLSSVKDDEWVVLFQTVTDY